jgi:uncharacterized protein (UPF0305 family)
MTDNNDRLSDIKKRLEKNAYFVNPHSDVDVVDDMKYLLDQVEKLQKKNDVLSQHNMELTQEMENVRSDFGNDR